MNGKTELEIKFGGHIVNKEITFWPLTIKAQPFTTLDKLWMSQ